MTNINAELSSKINKLVAKIDQSQSLESHYEAQVSHLKEELKKIDLNYEQEQLNNQALIQRFVRKVNKLKAQSVTVAATVREYEVAMRNVEKKIVSNSNVGESLEQYMRQTDRYLALFLPVQIMN